MKGHTKYSSVITKNCNDCLCFHVVTPRKYTFLELKFSLTILMLIYCMLS